MYPPLDLLRLEPSAVGKGAGVSVQKAQTQQGTKPALPRVIAISSGKGGVGKSSISVNLGISLAKAGARVCLLDADTGLANANILLGLAPEFSLEHVLYGAKAIEEVMLDGPHGLKIIPGANGISECVSLHPRQQLRLTRELARIEGDFDFLLIDTAAGIASTTLDFIAAAQHALVVITPEPTSLTDAFSLIKLLKRRRSKNHFHVLVNMCSSANQAKGVYHRFAAAVEKYIAVDTQYLGHILRDESMRAAVTLQNPVSMFPDSDPSSRGFITLSDKLDKVTAEVPVTSSFSSYWHRQFRQQRRAASETHSEVPVKAAINKAPPEAKENEYLMELQSRLLLLIDQGQVDGKLFKNLFQECSAAFSERYEQCPMDILALIERAVESPERDDQLLRDIAERVRPWSLVKLPAFGPSNDQMDQLQPEKQSNQAPDPNNQAPDNVGGDELESDQAASTEDDQSKSLESKRLNKAEEANATRAPKGPVEQTIQAEPSGHHSSSIPLRAHEYDMRRFGSQETLLDILQRQKDSDLPLAELLDSLV